MILEGEQRRDPFDPKNSYDYDLIVIGGGSGGLACAKVVCVCVCVCLTPPPLSLPPCRRLEPLKVFMSAAWTLSSPPPREPNGGSGERVSMLAAFLRS